MKKQQISELTVEQLQKLIKQTVQEALAEVLIEFSIAAEVDAEISYRAEITDALRAFLHDRRFSVLDLEHTVELDD